jgi:heme-degrading monooxygenase HmoA
MFIAMNRFRVKRGSEEAFEQVWLSRDTQLTKVPGFVEFHANQDPRQSNKSGKARIATGVRRVSP